MSELSDSAVAHLRGLIDKPDVEGTRYLLGEEIGRGGMGTVYLAEDSQLGRAVALKVLGIADSTPDRAARMLREARILARLEHPGIVPIHDAGTLADGRVFYAMKLVQGARLDRYRETGPSVPELLRVFERICEPVAFAHSHDVIHRDLKPENIMVGTFGEILILDWGVAKVLGGDELPPVTGAPAPAGHTEQGTIIGTPAYMSPEQSRGSIDEIDERTDIYALGKILNFLLAGRKVPRALDSIKRKATAADPAERYAGVSLLAADIQRFGEGNPVSAHDETLAERAARLAARYQTILALLLAYLFMRLLFLLWSMQRL